MRTIVSSGNCENACTGMSLNRMAYTLAKQIGQWLKIAQN